MDRVGYKYWIVVNAATGRLDNQCIECQLVRGSTSQNPPSSDPSHTVVEVNKINYNIMSERDTALHNFKNKWSKGQGKPVEDK